MLTEIVPEPRAWHGPTLTPDRYLVPIPDACLRELDAVVAELRKGPVPTLLLEPAHFLLEACARLMATVRTHLDGGAGVVVLDRPRRRCLWRRHPRRAHAGQPRDAHRQQHG